MNSIGGSSVSKSKARDSIYFPLEILKIIEEFMIDSRGLYLANRELYNNAPDRIYWESRYTGRVRHHLVKIPTYSILVCEDDPMISFAKYGNLNMVRHLYNKKYYNDTTESMVIAGMNGHVNILKYLFEKEITCAISHCKKTFAFNI